MQTDLSRHSYLSLRFRCHDDSSSLRPCSIQGHFCHIDVSRGGIAQRLQAKQAKQRGPKTNEEQKRAVRRRLRGRSATAMAKLATHSGTTR